MLDATDRKIVNALQGGFPVAARPYAEAAERLGLDEQDLIARIERMLADRTLTRFGPMYNAERMGGAFCLCAVAVPEERLDAVVDLINAHDEVAHNYLRSHRLNVWFVLGTETPERVDEVIAAIEAETGLEVCALPKEREFFVGLRVDA